MKQEPIRQEKHGDVVWINPTVEAIREEECLCFNCDRFRPNTPENCLIADEFFKLCVKYNNAFLMAWCRAFKKQRS